MIRKLFPFVIGCALAFTACTFPPLPDPVSGDGAATEPGRVLALTGTPLPPTASENAARVTNSPGDVTPTRENVIPLPPPALTFTAQAVGPTITPPVPPWLYTPLPCTPPPTLPDGCDPLPFDNQSGE